MPDPSDPAFPVTGRLYGPVPLTRLFTAALAAIMICASLSGCLKEDTEYFFTYRVNIETSSEDEYLVIVPFPVYDYQHNERIFSKLKFATGSGEFNITNTSRGFDHFGLMIQATGNITIESSGYHPDSGFKNKPGQYVNVNRYFKRLSLENLTGNNWTLTTMDQHQREWMIFISGNISEPLSLKVFYNERDIYGEDTMGYSQHPCDKTFEINSTIENKGWDIAVGFGCFACE